ncbi:MAG: helix-turn-helix domain-containing protein [Nanoarchaeota archaeon]|mgnify:CR=1 FL=1
MEKKYLLVSMEDEGVKQLAEVLGNKTCNKIIDFFAETKEASEKDISDALHIPMNTTEYNLKKLLQAGLIEKAKNHFWSRKGKKIVLYKLSNKSIIISPKNSRLSSKIKSLLAVLGISALITLTLRSFTLALTASNNFYKGVQDTAESSIMAGAEKAAESTPASVIQNSGDWISLYPNWAWFALGAGITIIIFAILNWRKL